jgi:DNA-binding NtrC family response regulator
LRADFRKLVQLAAANVPVLLLGETGTGKDVAAQALHELSKAEGKFVGVNCGAIPESLMESELFGSAKGSFSGAVRDRPGLVRDAHRGTLFLDEVGDLPLASQAALLRVLQERRVRPVGGTESVAVDFRLISATNQDIDGLVSTSRFRNDLYARIAGFRLHLPPLRERREDLGILVGTLLRRIAGAYADTLTLSQEAARRLYEYDFPLNVRELENWLTAAVALAEGGRIQREHLPEIVHVDLRESFPADGKGSSAPPKPLTDEQEEHRTTVIELLREHRGNVSAVARATGKARNQIQRWLKRYALNPEDYR